MRCEIKKSTVLLNPSVFTKISDLSTKDSKRLVEDLRQAYLISISEVEEVQEEKINIDQEFEKIQKEIKEANEEKERFKELFITEINKKNDLRSYISNQKKLKKTMSFSSKSRYF